MGFFQWGGFAELSSDWQLLTLMFMGVADHPTRLFSVEPELRYNAQISQHLETRTHQKLRRRLCLLVITHFVEITKQPQDNQRH